MRLAEVVPAPNMSFMAIEFARVRYVTRTDGGNACRSAAYNARSDIRCERTAERFFFAHRDPGLHHEVILPYGADARFRDPLVLWNEAQAMEKRKDSQEARELLLALPSNPGLDLDDWKTLCREFAETHFVSKGVAVQLDIHAPHDGEVNVHAHLLITTRRIEGNAFSTHKARDLDPEVRTMKGRQKIVTEAERWGAAWRDFQNSYFERQGLDIRVDETGFAPQRHEGPVRLRTVPAQSKARLAETRSLNEEAARDPVQVLAKLTENRATFTPLDVERLLRKHIALPADRLQIREAVLARPEVVPLYELETGSFANRYTTKEVRAEERETLDAATRIAKSRRPVEPRHARTVAAERTLDEEQQAAFLKATGTDGLVVIEGRAGTGKSYSLAAIREAHERSGWSVVGLAPMNAVADDLWRSGFDRASTAHREVWWQERGGNHLHPRWDRRTAIIVDEAAMLDTLIYARLMRQAAETGAKVILAGDDRQQGSVQRGGLFTQFKERHGSVVLSRVRRQETDWQRAASEDFAEGRIAEGLRSYAEHGHVHWSGTIDESRARLLSDWDQDSRERPQVDRFVYAATNHEVNRVNRAIHDIRLARREVANEIEADTVRGKIAFGTGDRIQFHGNDRKRGILNGATGTITGIDGTVVGVRTDSGRDIAFDAATFREFGLGYAGTVYRGQGKTRTEVYALYDNIFAWNAKTAYVGLTRHRDRVELYVSQDLAPSEASLAAQMSRQSQDRASVAWATEAEIHDLRKGRGEREGREAGTTRTTASQPFRTAEAEALRRIDLPAYARGVHGFAVEPHRSGIEGRFVLTRGKEELEVRRAKDGHWTWRNTTRTRGSVPEVGDIFDLARREGAPDLKAALDQVAAYDAAMREPNRHRRAAEAKARPEITPDAPAAGVPAAGDLEELRLARLGAEAERARDLAGAELEDRREAAGDAEERRQQLGREEAARIRRLDGEAMRARDTEQDGLSKVATVRTAEADAWLQARQAEVAAIQLRPAAPEPERAPETKTEVPQPEPKPAFGEVVGIPTPAQLRYSEALAQHYDPRTPIASLAQASLAEAAAYQRDRHGLDQRIAAEADPARRDALMLRRDIEHADHMGQAYGRIAFLAKANGADPREDQERAAGYREQGSEARRLWAERGKDHPDLYPELPSVRARVSEQSKPAPQERPEQARPRQDGLKEARTLAQERDAMQRLDLPGYAASKHGYDVEWRNQEQTRAVLTKGDEELRATKSKDGAWSYESRSQGGDRGDIIDFEVQRGAKSASKARENIRPELERAEQERGRLDPQPGQERGTERGQTRDGGDGPERDPDGRRGRGR